MGDLGVELVNFMTGSLSITQITLLSSHISLLFLLLLLIRDVHNTTSVIHLIFLVQIFLGSWGGLWRR